MTALASHADITGTVTLQGKPGSVDETFVARSFGCGESPIRHTENWKVGPKGELADVVVWIVNPVFKTDHPAAPDTEPEIKQIFCRYEPHVVVALAGQPMAFINGDKTLHNILARVYNGPDQPPGAPLFNFGQSYQGQRDEQTFDDPGIYTLQCSVHSWMQAWVMVLKNDCFAVTGLDGKFKLKDGKDLNLADGTYKIDAWHPRFPAPLEQSITVKNGSATINFTLDGAKSF
jgi:plastocyanin